MHSSVPALQVIDQGSHTSRMSSFNALPSLRTHSSPSKAVCIWDVHHSDRSQQSHCHCVQESREAPLLGFLSCSNTGLMNFCDTPRYHSSSFPPPGRHSLADARGSLCKGQGTGTRLWSLQADPSSQTPLSPVWRKGLSAPHRQHPTAPASLSHSVQDAFVQVVSGGPF